MRGQSRAGFSSRPWLGLAWTGPGSSSFYPRCCSFAAQSLSQICDGRLGRFLLVLFLTVLQSSLLFGQTPSSANSAASLQVGQDVWTFKEGAPEDVIALAQTADGFLWLGTEAGLVRFDGLRFEPFRSPFGDQLLSTGVYALFAPPSGGLWIGYQFGGFSFVNHGRVTNYANEFGSPTGGVWSFAQDGDGIVWAATTSGLWRFDHSRWQHMGAEWDAPQGNVQHLGFDSGGTLWALSGRPYGLLDLLFLMPGTRQFKVAAHNLFVYGFTLNADGAVVTEPEPNSLMADSRNHSDGYPSVYPVLRKNSF